MCKEEAEVEQRFALAAFLHFRMNQDEVMSFEVDCEGVEGGRYILFDGLRIHTCAACKSAISARKYHVYCQTLYLPYPMQTTANRSIEGIGGTIEDTGVVVKHVPFK